MTTEPFRLAHGGIIDRGTPVRFRFDGTEYQGCAGDTLASALIANGVHFVARSFKYHRPRGIVGAGPEDPAGLVQIGRGAETDPDTRVTEQEIWDGLEAFPQNCWPSLKYDVYAVNDWFSRFFSAGFYYKTFIGPPGSWETFEPLVRNSAGMGVAPDGPDPDSYESTNRHCDVLVIGAGPAGLMAALSAARSGARVILAEETAALGGRLLSLPADGPDALSLDGMKPTEWVEKARAELAEHPEATVLTRTAAIGYYAQNFVALWEKVSDHLAPGARLSSQPRQRLWRIRAKEVVLATGGIERAMVFHKNDRPGVMLASAVRTYMHRYAAMPGQNPVIFTNNDSAWATAFDLHDAGARVAAIVDSREACAPELMEMAAKRNIPTRMNSVVVDTNGRHRITDLVVARRKGKGIGPILESIEADLLAMSSGWSPNVALFAQSRGQLRWDDEMASFRPGTSWQKATSAGSANGTATLAGCLLEGAEVGAAAATRAGFSIEPAAIPGIAHMEPEPRGIEALWFAPHDEPPGKTKAFVDLQDDVKVADLQLAVREGYASVEHAKRYTTMGMGNDQGKISNLNAFGIIADALGKTIPEVGTTTFRQPWKPIAFGALAGQHVGGHFQPRRTTPMHEWHRKANATFEPVGDWLRARAYPQPGESFHDAVQRESKATRRTAGVLDASTLGKIDIRGKDARTFLNRVYTNAWSKLAPGRCRYGLMLGEDGMVFDDGVTSCIADDHFHMTTTTGGAARVLTWLEDYLQTEWPDLDVYLTSVTEEWAVASISGPKAADIVAAVCDDFDPETLPFMSWTTAHVGGIPVRVFHISFTGETSFEINIPATYGLALWEHILDIGWPMGLTPYGTETMHLLRAEKGFIIVGQETDGTMTPGDLRMDWIVSQKKGDFIGKRSLSRTDTVRTDRKQLVGLLTEDPNEVLMEGAQIIGTPHEPAPPVPMLGHVTSSYMSPNLGRSIAMGVVKSGGARMGETVYIARNGKAPLPATITETDFLGMTEDKANG
ncbi:MAG: sarcosine oxidase subunit alpha [Hyphomicrobiales bacterium]|nr:MAG: sarcosine oxidase subunit alpha [Hyphomicrobiales bacterium]